MHRGSKNYHTKPSHPRAKPPAITASLFRHRRRGRNPLGLLTQKQVITSPILHFGLGDNTQTDVARIVCRTVSVQAGV